MRRSRRTLFTLPMLALMLIVGAGTALAGSSGLPKLDGTDPITGKSVRISAYKGKPLVFHVWASWCPNCQHEAPVIASAVAKNRNVTFIGIDIADRAADAKRFYRKYGWRFVSIDDPKKSRMASLGVPGQPSTVFVDAKGKIVSRIIGEASEGQLALGIKLATKR